MLVKFTFNNFKCFKDETEVNFTPAYHPDYHYIHKTDHNYSVLRALAFYGANGSGKTKLFEGVKFMRCVVCPPMRAQVIPVFEYWQTLYDAFRLNTYSYKEESSFEMIFIQDDVQYLYGFTLDKEKIYQEWLYSKQSKVALVFLRQGKDIKVRGKYINRKIFNTLHSAGMISDKTPLLYILATFNDPLSRSIVEWLEKITVITDDVLNISELLDPDKKQIILAFLNAMDIDIDDYVQNTQGEDNTTDDNPLTRARQRLYSGEDGKSISTFHRVFDESYNIVGTQRFSLEREESPAVKKLLAIAWPVINTLKNGGVLFLDNLEGIHPYILKAIINLFYKTSTTAQLVFSTHDASLLSALDDKGRKLLCKDQIYMVNKNLYGESSVRPITDYDCYFRGSIERYYLEGMVSGIPYVDEDKLKPVV